MKIFIQILLFTFPWLIRRKLLSFFFGYEICQSAKIGFSIILASKIEMHENAYIGHLNYIGKIDKLVLGRKAFIGSLNWITGLDVNNPRFFSYNPERKCELKLEDDSSITSRHILDCNGGIYIGSFSIIAGYRSQFLSHSIDVKISRQTVDPIIIGKRCFVSTGCIILKGAVLPDYSVLGAGAVLTKKFKDSYSLYAGVPAVKKQTFDKVDYLYFNREKSFID